MKQQSDESMADYWADVAPAMKEASQKKRASNRENSAALLIKEGIDFYSKNGGAHLIVSGGGHTFDFWPGTGLWEMRGSTQRHRGVRKLIALIKRSSKQ